MDIAVKINKPVIIHSREATGDMYNILREYKGKIKGVMHCYSGSMEMAKEFIKLGFFISIGGVVTFKNAKTPKIVAKDIDLDYLLIETDSPYLSPEPFRGKRNEPKNTLYVAEKIAELRDMKVLDIIDITRKNAMKLFGIKK